MADNTVLNLGSGGDTVATDDIGGVKYQRVKIISGSDGINDGDVCSTCGIPVMATRGTLVDRSGTLSASATAQSLASANNARKYLLIQNISDIDMWFNFGTDAVQTQPSIKLVSGSCFTMESNFVSTQSVSIIGATSGKAFVAKEA